MNCPERTKPTTCLMPDGGAVQSTEPDAVKYPGVLSGLVPTPAGCGSACNTTVIIMSVGKLYESAVKSTDSDEYHDGIA